MKKSLMIIGGLSLLIFIYTFGLFNTYFQQDEWNGFGLVISLIHQPPQNWFNVIGAYHVIPLAQFFWFVLYKIFGMNSFYFALTAFILHVISSFLVYLVTKRLSKSEWVGIISAILFATNARAGDAFTHMAIFPATLTCFIAMMFFLYYLAKFKNESVIRLKDTVILLSLFLTAILLREDALMLVPLTLAFFFIYNKKIFSKKNKVFFISFSTLVLLFIAMRVAISSGSPLALTSTGDPYHIYLYNVITFPAKLIVQNFIEIYHVYFFVWEHITLLYPVPIPQAVMNTVVMDLIYLVLINCIIALFIFLSYKIKDKQYWKNIYFGISWILINAVLLAAVGRFLFMIEPRYLYQTSFIVSFIVGFVCVHVWQGKNGYLLTRIMRRTLVVVIVGFLLITSYQELQYKLGIWQTQGQARKQIIASLLHEHPTIPKNTIFFVQCKSQCHRNSEFGLPNDIVLPFSSGPGWIFMLQYGTKNEDAYAPFFTKENGKEFLWDYGTEGYKKHGEYGFGYFIDKDLLKETIRKEKLDKNSVIGLEYDEDSFILRDISKKVRNEL